MQKVWRGDTVVVLAGKDKGKQGTVLHVLADERKVVIEGVNIAKKHIKGDPNRGIEGGIVDKVMPIDVSNVALWNPKTQKADRVGIRYNDDGRKVRFFKSTGEQIGD